MLSLHGLTLAFALTLAGPATADAPGPSLSLPALVSCGPDAVYLFGNTVNSHLPPTVKPAEATDLWRYDTATANWTFINPTQPARYGNLTNALGGSPRAVCTKNTIYATLPDNTLARFNLATNSWHSVPLPPLPLLLPAPVAFGSTLAMVGGINAPAGVMTSSTLEFSITTSEWTQGPQYPHAINRAGAVSITGNAYVYGGFAGSFWGDLNVLAPPYGTWNTLLDPTAGEEPTPRENMCFTAWNDLLILYGGHAYLPGTQIYNPVVPAFYIFNTTANSASWTPIQIATLPGARAPSSTDSLSCVIAGSTLHVWSDGDRSPAGILHLLDLDQWAWSTRPASNKIAAPPVSVVPPAPAAPPAPAVSQTPAVSSAPAAPSTLSAPAQAAEGGSGGGVKSIVAIAVAAGAFVGTSAIFAAIAWTCHRSRARKAGLCRPLSISSPPLQNATSLLAPRAVATHPTWLRSPPTPPGYDDLVAIDRLRVDARGAPERPGCLATVTPLQISEGPCLRRVLRNRHGLYDCHEICAWTDDQCSSLWPQSPPPRLPAQSVRLYANGSGEWQGSQAAIKRIKEHFVLSFIETNPLTLKYNGPGPDAIRMHGPGIEPGSTAS
ncbi:hypothetical protein BDK51DRAFT_39715 [Blyttiomyces helicus]|uniref:Galactose oxidase n=1 Tax=Blyttiomyces helicus TaxID=388810 RepID=A0A4P9W849_9FUNG|nr:hypothetical protein BDK51DRAFT_39715 [Blyttiomyces helicus]|eukprot:RKO88689.1 hypothetical protein BDK51DRAFT_39715 [Blyttiomyces helicus]